MSAQRGNKPMSALPLSVFILAASASIALANDVVILNGRVIDPETGLDAIRNVAVEDGRITAISEFPLEGDTVIDAAGHVVSPGFIDLHFHDQSIGGYRMAAMQGVTTALELESGVLPIGEWYESQSKKNLPLNYGAAAAWTFGRIATFADNDPLSTSAYFQEAQSRSDWKMDIATDEQQSRRRAVSASASTPVTRRATATRSITPSLSWPGSMAPRRSPTSAMPACSSRKARSRPCRNSSASPRSPARICISATSTAPR
jgi:hypothetical protein